MKTIIRICLSYSLFYSLIATSAAHAAEAIEVPEEELARETVLPKFDRALGVKNRNVVTAKKIELSGAVSWSLTEAFFNNQQFLLQGTYYFSEAHALNLAYVAWAGGLSSYSKQLETFNMKFQYTPDPEYAALAEWQFNAYYGKMSLSKEAVMNLSLYTLLGAGQIGIGGESSTVLSAGLGQKFYFTPNLSMRFDLRMMTYEGPDVASVAHTGFSEAQKASAFKSERFYSPMLSAGLAYLF